MALAETAELAVRISLKDNVSGGIRKLQGNLGGLNRSLAQTGRGFGQIGAGVARAGLVVGGAAVAGIAAAAKAAIDFEDAFAGVRKTVNEADLTKVGLSFDILAKRFREMATEMPIAATDLARIGEGAGALGVKAQDIEKFTKTVALLGVTTNLTTDAATEALGKIGTILSFTGKDYEEFADILVNLGNTGASTESEIIEVTKRFAAQGKQAGLTTAEIAALSSSIVSLGAEPEAGGSSLFRLFSNISTEAALATKKGEAFARVSAGVFDEIQKLDKAGKGSHPVGIFDEKTDKEIKNITEAVRNRQGLPVFLKFLQELAKLDPVDQAAALKLSGITNVRDRTAILNMVGDLSVLDDALNNARNSTGALGVEAQKRFNTIASKLVVLKNNFIEAGITIGEGLLPALGRATDKLIAFLKVDANKSTLKGIGEDIGKAIDGIDWAAVLTGAKQLVEVMKGALTFAKLLFDAFMALPGPIKEATAGFLVLNKLSGNLVATGVGNVLGGLARTAAVGIAARAPGVGSLFAQPVFVTNWAMMAGGGLGGAGAAGAAATGLWSKVGKIIGGAFAVFAAAEIASAVHGITSREGGLRGRIEAGTELPADKLQWPWGPKNTPRWVIDGPFGQINLLGGDSDLPTGGTASPGWFDKLKHNAPVRPTVVDSPRTSPVNMAEIEAAIARGRAAGFSPSFAAAQETVQRNASRAAERQQQAASALINSALVQVRAGERLSLPLVIPAPTVNVNVGVSPTAVVTKEIYYNRYGPTGGSREWAGRGSGLGGGR